MKYKKDTWYKVYYFIELVDGALYRTFDYAMNEQIEELENKYIEDDSYIKTEEWIIKDGVKLC